MLVNGRPVRVMLHRPTIFSAIEKITVVDRLPCEAMAWELDRYCIRSHSAAKDGHPNVVSVYVYASASESESVDTAF
jgi:N-acyl-L-homoserine lactone synthetase